MNRVLVTIIVILTIIMMQAPAATASSKGGGGLNNDFLYQPQLIAAEVSPNSVIPNAIPYCLLNTGTAFICYGPDALRIAYGYPSDLDGTGQTILIVDAFGSPTITNDLSHFDSVFGIKPPPSFTTLCPPGGCPVFDPTDTHHGQVDWAIETSLDVEYAHAMAPGANIVLVIASTNSGNAINSAESQAIKLYPGSIMSQSFGIPEYLIHANNAQVSQANKNYIAAQAARITVFASAGDRGANNASPFINPLFPSSHPLVTSVGGTMGLPYVGPFRCPTGATCTAGLVQIIGPCTPSSTILPGCSVLGYGGEQVWDEAFLGAVTGGAPSSLFKTPTYQSGLVYKDLSGSTIPVSTRTTADVSYNAGVNGGVLVYTSFLIQPTFLLLGGTSAGSPQWAAVAALANQAAGHPLGFLNNAIYKIGNNVTLYQNDFHDIITGSNFLLPMLLGFSASKGWDPPSGWGTPSVKDLVPDLVANA